jgi:hypothetical protein
MVTVLLRGGLGNQMFQYALGVTLAQANRTALKLNAVYLQDRLPRRKYTYRNFDLDIFTMGEDPGLTTLSQVAQRVPVPGLWLGIDVMRMGTRLLVGAERVIREKSYAFDSGVLEERGDLFLLGYWQSEKYFADAEEELRKAFGFKHSLEGLAKEIGQQIRSSNSTSLHIRRGDYAKLKHVEHVMGQTNLSYYEKAASYMSEHSKSAGIEPPTLFVFSDDIEWCKGKLTLPCSTIYLDQTSAGPKASHHLQLMSLCRNNIIANSTFSWWGAWLNADPGKIVIAPERWFANKANEDIIPQDWIRM